MGGGSSSVCTCEALALPISFSKDRAVSLASPGNSLWKEASLLIWYRLTRHFLGLKLTGKGTRISPWEPILISQSPCPSQQQGALGVLGSPRSQELLSS